LFFVCCKEREEVFVRIKLQNGGRILREVKFQNLPKGFSLNNFIYISLSYIKERIYSLFAL